MLIHRVKAPLKRFRNQSKLIIVRLVFNIKSNKNIYQYLQNIKISDKKTNPKKKRDNKQN